MTQNYQRFKSPLFPDTEGYDAAIQGVICVGCWHWINLMLSRLELTNHKILSLPKYKMNPLPSYRFLGKYLFIWARFICHSMFTCLIFWKSIIFGVKIVCYCSKKLETRHWVNYSQSLLTRSLLEEEFSLLSSSYRTPSAVSFIQLDVQHHLIHCPNRASAGRIAPASVNGLHQEPQPERSCLLVWWLDVCSEVKEFPSYSLLSDP
jgi:hypothetical protein